MVGSAQRPADPHSDMRTEAPRGLGGGHGRSSLVSRNQADTTAKRKTAQQMPLGPPPLLWATLWVQSSCHSSQVNALRPPSRLLPSSSAPTPVDVGHSEAPRLGFLAASGESQGNQTRPLVEEWRRPSAKPGEPVSQGSLFSACLFTC